MNTFLQQTAKSIIEKLNWQQLSQTTLVLPSHRAGLVLKNELLRLQKEQGQKAIWAPQVLTLQQLQDQLSPLYAEDELLTIVRLYKRYSAITREQGEEPMPLDLFYGWGRQMIADFTNIDASMHAAEVPNFFDNTIAARELGRWELDEDVKERLKALLRGDEAKEDEDESTYVQEQYDLLWRNLHVLYDALRAEMLAEQKGYSGMRQRAVIEQWDDESIRKQIAGRTYVFVGFNYLLPVERELMQALKDAGQAMFYWDCIPNFQTNEKAFSFAEKNKRILGGVNDANDGIDVRPVTVMACTSREAQAQYVHRWLQENYTAKGQKVGVVICDETMLESVIYTLPEIWFEGQKEAEPVNITKGFPLRNTVVFARVLSWLYDRKRGDVEQVVSPDFIDELLKAIVSDHSDSSAEPLNWKELLILESEYQVRKVASQLRKLVVEGLGDVPFTLKLFRLLMRRVMESVTMPFHGEPVTDIQVMGVLETRLLDFDKLLLLNVEEGIIPQTQADNSFIPYYLRKAYSMQTSDERATVYAYNFFRLLNRAGHSTLLFTTTDGGDKSKGMSRFIMQMLVSPEFNVTKVQLKEQSVLQPVDEALLGTTDVSYAGKSLSPSALNTYITCPRLFCFNQIQGVRGADEDDVLFGASTLGSFVHYMMEYLYKDHLGCKNGKLTPVSPDSIEQILADETILETALQHAYDKANEEWSEHHEGETHHFDKAEHRPEKSVIITYVRHILERDKEDAEVGLKIYLLEQRRYSHITLADGTEIASGGIIDRVDVYGAGNNEVMRVIDYKSGKYESGKLVLGSSVETMMNHSKKDYIRQVLIYCQALIENGDNVIDDGKKTLPVVPNLYFCSRVLAGEKTGLVVNAQKHEMLGCYQDVQTEFVTQLTAKVQEIKDKTAFPPCEDGKCPVYCRFLTICGRKVTNFDE